MRFTKWALVALLLVASGSASAADWMTEDGGSKVCTNIGSSDTCWLTAISEDSTAMSLQNCETWTLTVFGSGSVVMPQTCTEPTCATAEDLLDTALTGTAPNAFASSIVPFQLLRIDWTSGNPTLMLKCGS